MPIQLGTMLSMSISATNGTLTPWVAAKLNLDPAKFAGPLETAFQVRQKNQNDNHMFKYFLISSNVVYCTVFSTSQIHVKITKFATCIFYTHCLH